jgi:SAM-dependent methyltransferase
MLPDKSLFFYGRPYHFTLDRVASAMRRRVLERVPGGSTVLDIGCGTGELALALRAAKNCRVLGLDMSQRMIDFATRRNSFADVTFLRADALSAVAELAGDSFDMAVMSQLLHEVPADTQKALLQAVDRVARTILLLDWKAPLPLLGPGAIPRMIEGAVGREHRSNYLAYLATGGLQGAVDRAGLAPRVVELSDFNRGTGQLIVLA